MEKLKMQTTNMVDENIKKIGELFPNCLTETLDENGRPQTAIDFDQLRQELSKDIVEGPEERYQFTWPDKRNAIRLANAPTTDTLRPCREESVDFDNTQNLYIEGDNLEVLKLLRQNYLGKVKMIYIDPPYNTGNDFVYNDEFDQERHEYIHNSGQYDEEGRMLVQNTESNGCFHTDWLNMIYPRLKVAKDLLSEDGAIFISIDDNEVENLSKICNEIFGEKNHLCTICVKNDSRARPYDSISITHEYMLVYKRGLFVSNKLSDKSKKFKYKDSLGGYDLYELRNRNSDFNVDNRPNLYYPFWVNPDNELEDNLYEIDLVEHKGWIMFYPQESQGIKTVWRWGKDRAQENLNTVIFGRKAVGGWQVVKKYRDDAYSLPSVWDDANVSSDRGTLTLKNFFNNKRVFSFPKSPDLISRCLEIASSKDSIILDFFSGSASTAHAVMRLNAEDDGNRKFIMVQLPEPTEEKSEAYKAGYKNICEIGKERIRRAGKKIKEDSPLTTQNLDTGFRVLKLDSSNMNDVFYTPEEFTERDLFEDNIKGDRTDEDLLFQTMIELGIELSAKIEKKSIAGKTVWSVSDGYLMACFDKDVNETTIKEIAKAKPFYFVMRDASLATDNVADNFEQIWSEYSKDTVRRIL